MSEEERVSLWTRRSRHLGPLTRTQVEACKVRLAQSKTGAISLLFFVNGSLACHHAGVPKLQVKNLQERERESCFWYFYLLFLKIFFLFFSYDFLLDYCTHLPLSAGICAPKFYHKISVGFILSFLNSELCFPHTCLFYTLNCLLPRHSPETSFSSCVRWGKHCLWSKGTGLNKLRLVQLAAVVWTEVLCVKTRISVVQKRW